ncbi:hypothetical protein B484DRAFT_477169 [Ochromonadaceae sp. CCMP2298]|nr:hypothetical protein B484DRAFT_477169 [Ochromonadaceae sp. CCMP2298]
MSSVSVVEAGVGESTLVPVPGRVLSEYTQGDFKLTMWIPSDYAGRVIGKKGAVITNLLRETRAKQINAMQPVGRSLWLPVVISGEYRHALAAYDAIAEIVEGGEAYILPLFTYLSPILPLFTYLSPILPLFTYLSTYSTPIHLFIHLFYPYSPFYHLFYPYSPIYHLFYPYSPIYPPILPLFTYLSPILPLFTYTSTPIHLFITYL